MRRFIPFLFLTLFLAACQASSTSPPRPAEKPALPPKATPTTPPSAATTTPLPAPTENTLSPTPQKEIRWEPVGLRKQVGDIQNASNLLVDANGTTIYLTFYNADKQLFFARTDDGGNSWTIVPLENLRQAKSMIQLADGTLILGGSGHPNTPILYHSHNRGDSWEPLATTGNIILPNQTSVIVWSLLALADGSIVAATDSLSNNPQALNTTIYRSTDGGDSWRALAPLPGLGVLSLAQDAAGAIYAGVEESAEHDDPDSAGQARVFKSADLGVSWQETGRIEGANRVYKLLVKRDGITILAGTGIRGEFYRSVDGGTTWQKMTHVPDGSNMRGDSPQPITTEATRIYNILELADGRILVGTGNKTGDIFISADDGATWEATGDTGPNIVTWGLAQTANGTLWAGTGSHGGDVLRATP